jgi:hypothetical protein
VNFLPNLSVLPSGVPLPDPWKEGSLMRFRPRSSDFVTKLFRPNFAQSTGDTVPDSDPDYTVPVPSPDPDEVKYLPLEWILDRDTRLELPELERIRRSESTEFLSERVLARLQQIEAHEAEASYRDDIRIAWLTVLHCQRGDAVQCTPHVLATYEVLGCHPEQVYAKTILRRVAMFGATAKIIKFPSPKSSPNKSDEEKTA